MSKKLNEDVKICIGKIHDAIEEVVKKHNHLVIPSVISITGFASTLPIGFTIYSSEVLLMREKLEKDE